MVRKTCKGCLWNWQTTPENLIPGLCYCGYGSKYKKKAEGGCESYTCGLRKGELNQFKYRYGHGQIRIIVNHDRRFME